MRIDRYPSLLILLLLPVLCTGCGPKTRLVQSWSDPGRPAPRIDHILVIGISRNENSIRLWENVFVDAFSGLGIRAEAGHRVIGTLPEPDHQALAAAARKSGATAILITRVVDVDSETTTHHGMVHFEPRAIYRRMDGYYGTAYRAVHMPPVEVTRTRVSLESNLYAVATGRLLWSARAEARDPRLLRSDYEQAVSLLVHDLQGAGLLP